jgi:hypothetical protein
MSERFVIEKLERRVAPSACNGITHSAGLFDPELNPNSVGGGLLNGNGHANANGQAGILNAATKQIKACVEHG